MAKDYGELYRGDDLYWGTSPSQLVKKFGELAPAGKALDLGMGEGRDALYIASLGFDVTGVELTDSGVVKCQKLAEQKGYRVRTICEDARDYKVAKNRYSLIACINLFQFMTKIEAQAIVTQVVGGLKRNGLFLCQAFTIDDPSFAVRKKKSKEIAPGVFQDVADNTYSLYSYGELLKLCSGLRPIYYSEYDYYDTMMGPPHWHGVADFVGKKL
jgi:cyclopropane fatty-acyl-phospholipid synthase-like methyltransferase